MADVGILIDKTANVQIVSNDEVTLPEIKELKCLKKEDLKSYLEICHLSTQGNKPALYKRLRTFLKKRMLVQNYKANAKPGAHARDRFYDYLCIIDFECTCELGADDDYQQEIIEFPCVLVETSSMKIVDHFRSYCKPMLNPRLSDFCTELTGIVQEQVDNAPELPTVLKLFDEWLEKHELTTGKYGYAFVTDGPWDLGHFLPSHIYRLGLPIPHHMRYWINLRKTFRQQFQRQKINLKAMLCNFGLTFEGREHCGLDDAKNIARIVQELLEIDVELRVNEMLARRDKAALFARQKSANHQKLQSYPNEQLLDSPSVSKIDRQSRLPYKVMAVTKHEFMLDLYEKCFSCDEYENDLQKT